MECDICGKEPRARFPFLCPSCVRTAVYPLRLEHAAVLLDKEAMGRRVEAVVKGAGHDAPRESLSLSGAIIDTHDCAKAYELERIKSESAALSERIQLIDERAKALRSEMEEHKKTITARRASLSQRRSDAESATYGLEAREARELDGVQAGIRRTKRRWEMKHDDIVTGRISLCREAARLAGLKRHRKTREDGNIREYFWVGNKLPIFDLRELHTAKPEELTASLTQLAYLTARVSTYLAVRLPAEITLPHRGYPLPTIFNPQASYSSRDVPFPGTTPAQSSTNSPAASRILDQRPLPRPRPLFVHSTLAKLAKDDPQAYSMFVEGVTFLAWDIAWLCKTQGMRGLNSEADICPIGRNLWNLLQADPKAASPNGGGSANRSATEAPSPSDSHVPPPANAPALFGQFSHGTAHSFFGLSGGRELMHNWKLQNPARASDKIKEYLKAEMQKAEWEVLQENEWDAGGAEEEAVVVGGRGFDQDGKAVGGGAVKTTSTLEAEAKKPGRAESVGVSGQSESQVAGPAKLAGAKGWTRVRNRNSATPTTRAEPTEK